MTPAKSIQRDNNWADVFERLAKAHEAFEQPKCARRARKAAKKARACVK